MTETSFSRTYKAVKANLNARLASAMVGGIDLGQAERWTPDDYAMQAETIGDIVSGAQLVVGNLTTVDIARKFGGRVAPLGPSITKRDNDIPKALEYQRPFRAISIASAKSYDPSKALQAGMIRLNQLTDTDLQMAKVRQAQVSLRAVGAETFRRETTSEHPCGLCEIAATQIYYTDQLMDIHPGCSCDIIPNDGVSRAGMDVRLIDTRDHGEIGPVLTWRGQHFTGPDQLPHKAFSNDLAAVRVSKQRQLENMKKQLSRSIEHGGGKEFFSMTAIDERNELLDQAREIVENARAAAPALVARIKAAA